MNAPVGSPAGAAARVSSGHRCPAEVVAISRMALARVLVGIGLAWGLTTPALGQYFTLRGAAWTTGGPFTNASHVNEPVASLTGLYSEDWSGNVSTSSGNLAAPAGSFTLSSHACGGGQAAWGGQANGTGFAEVDVYFTVTSATLPPGTPAIVRFQWSTSGRVVGIGVDMAGVNTVADSAIDGRVSLYVNGSPFVNRTGHFGMHDDAYQGLYTGRSGSLRPDDDHGDDMVPVLVGQVIEVWLQGAIGCASSVEGGKIDCDAQLAVVWGLTPQDAAVTLVRSGADPGEAVPPAETATPERADSLRPPRPDGPYILPCFSIPTQPDPAFVCTGDAAGFSVGLQGQGPFTYAWRRNGVPLDADANPSAATATLSLSNVSAADAGSYDCVITNPCGSITSTSAVLAVGAPTITTQPSAAAQCGAGAAPFSVAIAGGGGGDTYQWQIQTAPGVWQDLTSDIGPIPCGGAASVAPENAASVQVQVTPCPGVSQYSVRCIVSSACGSITSDAATLTLTSPPTISAQPGPATACTSGSAVFSVGVGGDATGDSFQWQVQTAPGVWQDLSTDGSTLPCGGSASVSADNSASVQLGVTPCPGVAQYQVRCIVSNACGSATSDPATYTVCFADSDCNGQIQPADIATFVNSWFASLQTGGLAGDFDGNGQVQPADIAAFVNAWFGALANGC